MAGHGLPAAFIAAMTKIIFDSYAPTTRSSAELLARLNRQLAGNLAMGAATAFAAGPLYAGLGSGWLFAIAAVGTLAACGQAEQVRAAAAGGCHHRVATRAADGQEVTILPAVAGGAV